MKIEAHITAVVDGGDTITITGQGRKVRCAEWMPWLTIDIKVPATDINKRTYHLGRQFNVHLEPA